MKLNIRTVLILGLLALLLVAEIDARRRRSKGKSKGKGKNRGKGSGNSSESSSKSKSGSSGKGSSSTSSSSEESLCTDPPHTDECLLQTWEAIGCTPEGTEAPPDGANIDTWREMEFKEMKKEMKAIYKEAMEGKVDTTTGTQYVTMCNGKEGEDCGPNSTPGPHTQECLLQMWLDVGCYETGTGYPVDGQNATFWNKMTVGQMRKKMTKYQEKAMEGKKNKVALCYGCGISGLTAEEQASFIVGGSDVTNSEVYPWMAIVLADGQYRCTGGLISPQWVITSSGCVKDIDISTLSVQLGTADQTATDPPAVTAGVLQTITHEDYENSESPFKVVHDLALIQLDQNVTLGQNIVPICLPKPGRSSYTDCHVGGWGQQEDMGPNSDILQDLSVELLDDDECASQTGYTWIPTGGTQCAVGENGGNICQGDSGALLFCKQGADHYVAVGLASWTAGGCSQASSDTPMGFGQVDEKLDWIQDKCTNEGAEDEVMSEGDEGVAEGDEGVAEGDEGVAEGDEGVAEEDEGMAI